MLARKPKTIATTSILLRSIVAIQAQTGICSSRVKKRPPCNRLKSSAVTEEHTRYDYSNPRLAAAEWVKRGPGRNELGEAFGWLKRKHDLQTL